MTRRVIGIGWYRARDWTRLREIAADPEELEEAHTAWLTGVKRVVSKLERDGLCVRKVIVDLDELIDSCRHHGIPVDSAARARFVAHKVHTEDEQSRKQ